MIELLVVISMIGLLTTMLLPSLKRSMQLASDTICMHHLREIGHTLAVYTAENDGWLPYVEQTGNEIEALQDRNPWFLKLYPTYLNDPLILTCPKDPFRYRLMRVGSELIGHEVADAASYGINSFIMTAGGGFLANRDRYRPSRPHDTILLADLGPDDAINAAPSDVRTSFFGPFRNASFLAWDDGFNPFTGKEARPWLTQRHGNGINFLTWEGGVRTGRTTEAMRQPMSRYYTDCAAGGCTFCKEFGVPHYSFARDRLYWWTGPTPTE